MKHTGVKHPKGKPWQGCQLCGSFGSPSAATVAGVRLCERHLEILRSIARENGQEITEAA